MVQETILNDLGKIGVSILSVTDGDLLEDDPTRILVRQVMGAIAQYDKAMTVQKLRVARDRKRARDGKCEGGKAYIEAAPELVREVKRLRRKRKGRKQRTMNEIGQILNKQGHRTAKRLKVQSDLVRVLAEAKKIKLDILNLLKHIEQLEVLKAKERGRRGDGEKSDMEIDQ